MENPLKRARLQRGLTLESLSRQTGITKQCIIRAEQGTYVNPPPTLVSYLFPDSPSQLEADQAYRDFQFTTRQAHAGLLIPTPAKPPVGKHPFVNWREHSQIDSTIRFCILFCCQHSIMQRFENNPKTVAVPTSLRAALLDANITEDAINFLEILYQTYRRELRLTNVA